MEQRQVQEAVSESRASAYQRQFPLHWAAARGLYDAVDSLLSSGADPTLRDNSRLTPLHHSFKNKHIRVSLLLLQQAGVFLGDTLLQEKLDRASRLPSVSGLRRPTSSTSTSAICSENSRMTPLDVLSKTLRGSLKAAAISGYGGEVLSFGKADYQLGYEPPNAADVLHPRRVNALKHMDVVRISASAHASMAVTRDGQLYTWGHGKGGRLGHGDDAVQLLPRLVSALSDRVVTEVATAENHCAVITHEGEVFTFGSNRWGQLGHGKACVTLTSAPQKVEALRRVRAVAVACGTTHTAIVTSPGDLWTFGGGKSGQLGYLVENHQMGLPRKVVLVRPGEGLIKTSRRVVAVSAAASSTVVITKAHGDDEERYGDFGRSTGKVNEVYQWGHGNYSPMKVRFGMLSTSSAGVTTHIASDAPASVCDGGTSWEEQKERVNIVQVSAAKYHNVALCSTGQVFTWGFGADSLGLGQNLSSTHSSTPKLVTAMLPSVCNGRAVHVSASSSHTAVLTESGDLYTWGTSDDGAALGQGGERWQPVARRVAGVKRAIMVAAAPEHTVVLLAAMLPRKPHEHAEQVTMSDIARALPSVNFTTNMIVDHDSLALASAEEELKRPLDIHGHLFRHRCHLPKAGTFSDSDSEDYNDEPISADAELFAHGDISLDEESSSEQEDSNASRRKDELCTETSPARILSLKQMCEVVLAPTVDLKSAPLLLTLADAYDAPDLMRYCAAVIKLNLDAVFVMGKPHLDWPAMLDIANVHELWDNTDDAQCTIQEDEEQHIFNEEFNYYDLHIESAEVVPATIDNSNISSVSVPNVLHCIEEVEDSGCESSNAVVPSAKAVRRQLARISELSLLEASGVILTQKQKQLLARDRDAQVRSKPIDMLDGGGKVPPEAQFASGETLENVDVNRAVDVIVTTTECAACGIKCPNHGAYLDHMKGRRHTLRMVAIAVEQEEEKLRDLQRQKDEERKSRKAWGSHTASSVTKKPEEPEGDQLQEHGSQLSTKKKTSFRDLLEEEARKVAAPPPLLACPPSSSTPVLTRLNSQSSTSGAGKSQQSPLVLGEFISPNTHGSRKSLKAGAVTTVPPVVPAWSTPNNTSTTPSIVPILSSGVKRSGSASDGGKHVVRSLSFADIIAEEEIERSQLKGGFGPQGSRWHMVKKTRSLSLEDIQGEQREEQEKARLRRIQKEAEDALKKEKRDIARAIRLSKLAAAAEAGAGENNNANNSTQNTASRVAGRRRSRKAPSANDGGSHVHTNTRHVHTNTSNVHTNTPSAEKVDSSGEARNNGPRRSKTESKSESKIESSECKTVGSTEVLNKEERCRSEGSIHNRQRSKTNTAAGARANKSEVEASICIPATASESAT